LLSCKKGEILNSSSVRLVVASHVTKPLEIPFCLVTTDHATLPMGYVYLEPGKRYDCNVINDHYIEFLDTFDEAYLAVRDLQDLVRQGSLTITKS
jgi:hypothetical protein